MGPAIFLKPLFGWSPRQFVFPTAQECSERFNVKVVFTLMCVVVCSLMCVSTAEAQWTDLIANRSLHHWMKPSGESVDQGWTFDSDGTLHLKGRGGNIITRRHYCDFELWFDFRISEKGNSGVKYRVKKYGTSLLGCEYQVLDDSAFPKLDRNHITASLYDIYEPMAKPTRVNPVGEFSTAKVLVQGNRIRHWVNGQLTIDVCAGSPGWNTHVQNSKFNKRDRFGQNRMGRIMLTDHNSEVWYRNVYIRPR